MMNLTIAHARNNTKQRGAPIVTSPMIITIKLSIQRILPYNPHNSQVLNNDQNPIQKSILRPRKDG
jgi:hypothetical protein